jgi:hypothetical protein
MNETKNTNNDETQCMISQDTNIAKNDKAFFSSESMRKERTKAKNLGHGGSK